MEGTFGKTSSSGRTRIPEGCRPRSSLRSRPALVLLLGSLILLVVVERLLTHAAFDASVARVETILNDSTPSVIELVEARRVMREIRSEAVRSCETTDARRAQLEDELRGAWQVLERRIAAYERLPVTSARERAGQEDLDKAVRELKDAVSAVLGATDLDGARLAIEHRLTPASDDAAHVIAGLIQENANEASRAASDTVLAHEKAKQRSFIFLLLVIGVTVTAGLFADRSLTRAERESARRMAEVDAFSAHAAHDIRGPLSPAVMALALLRRTENRPDGDVEKLDAIDRSLRRVLGLVDGLLEFARAGATPEPDATASFEEVVVDVRPALEALAAEERAELRFDMEPRLHARMSKVVLGSIVDNLGRNALLYLGDSERRAVSVVAKSEGETALVQVVDTGPGIPADALPRLFQAFERGSSRPGGSGLGLATVRRLVEAHGGKVSVRSQVGLGSTFEVRLPRRPPG
jgi:signal transduction histidine kinase